VERDDLTNHYQTMVTLLLETKIFFTATVDIDADTTTIQVGGGIHMDRDPVLFTFKGGLLVGIKPMEVEDSLEDEDEATKPNYNN